MVRDVADKDCNIIFGAKINNESSGETEITVIATGFETYNNPTQESLPEFKDNSADFEAFTQPVEAKENFEDDEEDSYKEDAPSDTVEDISINSKKTYVDDDTIPPFLRKLKR